MIWNDEKAEKNDGLVIRQAKEPEPIKKPIKHRKASEIEVKPAKWLWYPYLIDANTNVFGGEAGTGKTWCLSAIMAAVTQEKQPAGMPGIIEKHGKVLYIGSEEGDDAMTERLKSVGADLNLVELVEGQLDCKSVEFRELVEEIEPALIIFDPILSYFPKDANPNSYIGARDVMDYLRDFAREKGICIICVVHPPKKDDYRLIHRFTGSGGFVDAVRTATYIGYHPTDASKRIGIQPKNNLWDTIPFTFSLDRELGFMWCGDDEEITIKDVEGANKVGSIISGKAPQYIKVITELLKVKPQGFELTASDILKEYGKITHHNIDATSFGRGLANKTVQNELQRKGIILQKGSNTGNRQKYCIYYEDHKPFA